MNGSVLLWDTALFQGGKMISTPNCYKRGCVQNLRVIQPDGTEMTERPACDAYPDGIPSDIAYGPDQHLEVRSDQDNEIIFKKG